METLFIPNKNEFKKMGKRCSESVFRGFIAKIQHVEIEDDYVHTHKEIAKYLRISLVTLTDRMKRRLPSHKQRGRVYFMKKEVINYIKENKLK